MDVLQQEHERLSKNSNLSKSIDDVQNTIDLLLKARDTITAGMWLNLSYNTPPKVSKQCTWKAFSACSVHGFAMQRSLIVPHSTRSQLRLDNACETTKPGKAIL